MSFSDFFAFVRRYNQNATVIFDREEPIGHATDLVMPRRRWFGPRVQKRVVVGQALPPAETKRWQAGAVALHPPLDSLGETKDS